MVVSSPNALPVCNGVEATGFRRFVKYSSFVMHATADAWWVWLFMGISCFSSRLNYAVGQTRRAIYNNFCNSRGYYQGCSANKIGVGTHPKNSYFETTSNSLTWKSWKRCGNAVPMRYRPITPLGTTQRRCCGHSYEGESLHCVYCKCSHASIATPEKERLCIALSMCFTG